MKRRMLALFLALFLGIALTGCADVQSNNGPYKMYLIAKSTTTEFWKSVFAGANAAKSEYNVDLTVLGPDTHWSIAPDIGRFTRIAPKPIGSSRLGSISFAMAR